MLYHNNIGHFKDINDVYVHIFGNAVLKMVGNKLQNAVRGFDIASRWGSDEFLGILTLDLKEAQQILNGFMDTLKNSENEDRCHVTVSIRIIEVSGKLTME
ncbi:MAG: diguanylate cyclase [Clostridiales bacterium]|nr:diguanylate cyclase [Clostridiales bacterium]